MRISNLSKKDSKQFLFELKSKTQKRKLFVLDYPFLIWELAGAIKKLNTNRSAGKDDIINAFLINAKVN